MYLPTWPHRPSTRTLLKGLALAFALGTGLAGVEALLRARLNGGVAHGTTRLFARPRVIESGTRLSPVHFKRYLDRMGYRTARGDVSRGEFRREAWSWTVGRRAFRVADRLDSGGVVTFHLDYDGRVMRMENANGDWLSRVVLEPEPLRAPGSPHEDRMPVRLADVPPSLVEAVLAVEDQRFYDHPGVDPARVVGAALANLRAGRIVQGASTITQQLAKNLFLTARRTPLRKARELAMALVLEARHPKAAILEAYLNEVYLGQDGGFAVRGVGRAAQFYFGKDVTQLTVPESALLAGLIRGPNLYRPLSHPEAARQRRDLVLELMRAQGRLTDAEFRRAARAPLGVHRGPPPVRSGRYFADYVMAELESLPNGGARSGATVFTTLDMDLQLAAEAAVRSGIRRLERDHTRLRRPDGALQAALVALDPVTGDLLAMVGGRDYGTTQFNRAVHARRQPGSAFKPIVALAGLSQGVVTLASRLEDQPFSVEIGDGTWTPVNYDGAFRGSVSLRQALEGSLNVPFARLGLQVGLEQVRHTARQVGITSPLRPVPSLALGASEVTPLELARAFAVLAAGGFRAEPHAVLGTLDGRGTVSYRAVQRGEWVFTPAQTYLVTSALEGAVERGTGRGVRAFGYEGPVAAKSGTTNDYRDAWFVGYTADLTVAVWTGFDDGQSLGLS
ncbi:MAG TPA: PBP1A family penicillin-binding protein, partial [Gemmatimonadales bacterium]|nr:PBP1A family penicillin-binding protein [Gemmatimonadales bacterium]